MNFPRTFIGPASRVTSRGAHRKLTRADQHQFRTLRGGNARRYGSDLCLFFSQQAHLDFLRDTCGRRNRHDLRDMAILSKLEAMRNRNNLKPRRDNTSLLSVDQ